MDIAAGRNISIKINAVPSNTAACKTLTRLCSKDPVVARAKRWRKDHRPSWEHWRRGGKMWHHQMKSHAPLRLEPGATFNVLATVDVLRELESVQRFVTLSPI